MPNFNKPLVSIIICCHNRAHLLPETMASVFNQNYQPVEIIVLDDGSTDNTAELMESYGNKIRYIKQTNQGIAITRTNACRLAKGEYIAFQDDDDIMPPDRITMLYDAISRYPDAVLAVGDYVLIDEDGNLTGKRSIVSDSLKNEKYTLINNGYQAVLWPKVPVTTHTVLFKKSDGEKIGWFDAQYKNACEDKDFFARIGRLGPIVYLPEIMSYYRKGHESLTKNKINICFQKLILFENHMILINNKNDALYKRLQHRILVELKKISYLKNTERDSDNYLRKDLLRNAIERLRYRYRIQYWWYSLIKMRIRGLIKKS